MRRSHLGSAGLWLALFSLAFAEPATNPAPAAASSGQPASTPQRALEKLKKKYGENCLYEVNDELKLVFATTADRRTMQALQERLSAFAQATRRDLFTHGLQSYCAVAVPKKWPGDRVSGHFYPDWVDARTIGPTLLHEFTHALHFADQGPRGQEHPVWVVEGLASLFEYSRVVDGHVVPRHNHQLADVREDLRLRKTVPWEKMVKFEHRQFHSVHYAQGRYMMFYLYDKGVLKNWYDAFCAGYAEDATGGAALEKVLGKKLPEIEKDWIEWVGQLPETPAVKPGCPSLGAMHSQEADGLRIGGFLPDSAARKAGLQMDDVLVSLDGERVVELEELVDEIMRRKNGDSVKVGYRRGDEYAEVAVTLTPLVLPARGESE